MLEFSGEGVGSIGEVVRDEETRDEGNSVVLIVGGRVPVTMRSPKDPLVG